jgi:hypothetical protein
LLRRSGDRYNEYSFEELPLTKKGVKKNRVCPF